MKKFNIIFGMFMVILIMNIFLPHSKLTDLLWLIGSYTSPGHSSALFVYSIIFTISLIITLIILFIINLFKNVIANYKKL